MPIFPIFRPRQKMPPAHTFAKPTVTTGSFVHDGEAHAPVVEGFYNDFMTKSGDTSETDVGEYTLTIALTDTVNCQWEDGTTAAVELAWEITAEPTP